MSFYNTINLMGREKWEAIINSRSQEKRIIEIFKAIDKPMTPTDVHKLYCSMFPECPITSIRRAMTVLTKEKGLLTKTEDKIKGNYHQPNYKWTLTK